MAMLESDIRGNVLATDTRCILAFVIVLELAKKIEPTVQEKESRVCTRYIRVGAMASEARGCTGFSFGRFHNSLSDHVKFSSSPV